MECCVNRSIPQHYFIFLFSFILQLLMDDFVNNEEEILKQGELLQAEEDRMTEFKSVQFTKKLIETILKLSQEYINAFLNTNGGAIYFGFNFSSYFISYVKLSSRY